MKSEISSLSNSYLVMNNNIKKINKTSFLCARRKHKRMNPISLPRRFIILLSNEIPVKKLLCGFINYHYIKFRHYPWAKMDASESS
jgi:hypothetical protein